MDLSPNIGQNIQDKADIRTQDTVTVIFRTVVTS